MTSAINVKEKVFINAKATKCLRDLNKYYRGRANPLRSISNMQEIINRCSGEPELIGDVLEVLCDFFRMEFLNKSHFVQQKLEDPAQSCVEMANILLGVKGHLFNVFLPSLAKNAADTQLCEEFRQNFANISDFRANMTPYPKAP